MALKDRIVAASRALARRGRRPAQPLSLRLRTVADLVPSAGVLLDVGTDHGWLVVHLLHERRVKRAIASDLRPAPLAGATERLAQHDLSGSSETRLGNGLETVAEGEVDVVTICGMGGRSVVEICESHPGVLRQVSRLVVQPNSEPERVRAALSAMGLSVVDERLIHERGHWYPVIAWEWTDEPQSLPEADLWWGPILRQRADPELRRFLGEELTRVATTLADAMSAGASLEGTEKLRRQLGAVEAELARLALVAQTISKRANRE